MRYFKRMWEENRGDEFSSWGCATYVFEIDDVLQPIRQLEIYDNGKTLVYSGTRPNDEYGMLADQPLDEDDFRSYEISSEEFMKILAEQKLFHS